MAAAKASDNALIAGAVGGFLLMGMVLKGLRLLLFLVFVVFVLAPVAELRRLILGDGAVLKSRRGGNSLLKSMLA